MNRGLRKAAFDNCAKFDLHVANAVLNKFYIDDYLDSLDSLDELITTVHDVIAFLTFVSFNLATFISSNRITLKNLSRESFSSKAVNLDLEELLTESPSKNLGRDNRYA